MSGGFSGAYQELLPQFQKTTGITVTTARGASQGDGPNTIGAQLRRGVWLPGQAGMLRDYDLTPDGKRVVALQRVNPAGNQQSPSHVTFLLNFADELRRRSK